MQNYLTEEVKITADAPTVTGTTAIDSTILDMAGYDGVLWIVRLGAPNAGNNIRARQDTDPAMAAAADLLNTLVNHATNNVHMLELKAPLERYVRCRVTRGVTTTIDTLVAIQYRAANRPPVQPTSILEQHLSPVEGTA
jgi:hypothetical protein